MPSRKSPSQRKYGPKASQKVERAMHEMKRGQLKSGRSGKAVRSPQRRRKSAKTEIICKIVDYFSSYVNLFRIIA